jgi:hypothetical protein
VFFILALNVSSEKIASFLITFCAELNCFLLLYDAALFCDGFCAAEREKLGEFPNILNLA